jgi:predicted metal-binding membrane protein
MPDVVIAALILGPAVLTYFLRSNGALQFLSICTGMAVFTFAALDIQHLVKNFGLWLDVTRINLLLLFIPLILTIILTRHAVRKGPKLVLQVLAALAAGYLLVLLAVPLLILFGQDYLAESSLWRELLKVKTYVIGGGALLSLVLVWLGSLSRPSKKHK